MIYEAQGHRIDLSRLTRLYPAAIVKMGMEEAQVSLEWAELKAEKVAVSGYVLVFDVDPGGTVPKNRVVLAYATRADLEAAMQEIAALF